MKELNKMSFAITGKKVGIQAPPHNLPLKPQPKPKTVKAYPKTLLHSKPAAQTKPPPPKQEQAQKSNKDKTEKQAAER